MSSSLPYKTGRFGRILPDSNTCQHGHCQRKRLVDDRYCKEHKPFHDAARSFAKQLAEARRS